MNILILNWRDPKNPRSGGAEVITYKYAKYWTSRGHHVFWVSNYFSGAKLISYEPNLTIFRIRPELGYTVKGLILSYPLFLRNATGKAIQIMKENRIDLVVDEIHGLPFFTPFYSRPRHVLLVCEVAGPIWDKMFPFPISKIGKLLEKIIYILYQNTETWAISQNSQKDIFNLNHNKNIKILPLGIDPSPISSKPKFPYPSAVFLGRLVRMKGIESAIYAAGRISYEFPKFKLYVAGAGSEEYLNFLKSKAKEIKARNSVIFCGYLSDAQKKQLLAKSHFLIHPSFKEGFGLTILEAASVGTPAIARKGSSLDELVKDRVTGFLFTKDSDISACFKAGMLKSNYAALQSTAVLNSRRYFWDAVLKKSGSITGIK